MEALVLRLSQLDAHAEGAIRVVMFYDTLIRRRVDLPALARASAGLAGCVAGIRLHGAQRVIRVAPDGSHPPTPPPSPSATAPAPSAPSPPAPAASATAPVTLDDEDIGTVWLERPGLE
jgi:hypothetical protein